MDRIVVWKAIGQSVLGVSHSASAKTCEDAIDYEIVPDRDGNEVLICCVSDGAGSASQATLASNLVVRNGNKHLKSLVRQAASIKEADIFEMAESIYGSLSATADTAELPLEEYSCTLLGCVITSDRSVFFQIGDGAIVRYDASDSYTPVWWPENGEYQNTTSFLTDDKSMGNLRVLVTANVVDEVAIFTDGLQQLALKNDSCSAHQPFFNELFRYLRIADSDSKVATLNAKLRDYLDSKLINQRTDDDKTLFLATRIKNEV